MSEGLKITLISAISVWLLLSLGISASKASGNGCDKNFPIDYVLYTGWFCEIEKEDE